MNRFLTSVLALSVLMIPAHLVRAQDCGCSTPISNRLTATVPNLSSLLQDSQTFSIAGTGLTNGLSNLNLGGANTIAVVAVPVNGGLAGFNGLNGLGSISGINGMSGLGGIQVLQGLNGIQGMSIGGGINACRTVNNCCFMNRPVPVRRPTTMCRVAPSCCPPPQRPYATAPVRRAPVPVGRCCAKYPSSPNAPMQRAAYRPTTRRPTPQAPAMARVSPSCCPLKF